MKVLTSYCFIALCLFSLVSCSKEGYDYKNENSNKNKSSLLSNSFINYHLPKFDPIRIESPYKIKDLVNSKKMNSTNFIKDSLWSGGVGHSEFYSSDRMVVTPNNENYIYPGSLLKGESINTDDFKPIIGYKSLPIKVSVTFPSSYAIGQIDTPSLSRSRVFLRKALMAPDFSGVQLLDFSYSASLESSYDASKLYFGYDVNDSRLFSSVNESFSSSSSHINSGTALMASFTVENFSFNMASPVQGELLDPSTLDPASLNNVTPVYVSSVTYGRFGYFLLETEADSYVSKSAFEKIVKKIFKKTNEELTIEEQSIFNSCKVTIYLLGANGDALIRAFNSPSADGLYNYLLSYNSGFTADDPGVPIFYKLKYLSNDSLYEPVFKIDYAY